MTYVHYLKYKMLLNFLQNETTAEELVTDTGLTRTSVYKMVKDLLDKEVIYITRYDDNERVMTLKI